MCCAHFLIQVTHMWWNHSISDVWAIARCVGLFIQILVFLLQQWKSLNPEMKVICSVWFFSYCFIDRHFGDIVAAHMCEQTKGTAIWWTLFCTL